MFSHRKITRSKSILLLLLVVMFQGAVSTTVLASSPPGSPTHYYFRLSPVTPWLQQLVDDVQAEYSTVDSAVFIAVDKDQAKVLFSEIAKRKAVDAVSVSMEQIPRLAYESPEKYPIDVYEEPALGLPQVREALAPQKTAIVVDQTTYQSLSGRLQTYINDVKSRFGDVDLQVYHPSSTQLQTAAGFRSFLQQIHSADGVNGAILIGSNIPYAIWEFPWGETAALPLFYEDLDGVFLDQDSDGVYDYRDWGPNEGLEMWVSWIRPPLADPTQFLANYFDKVHAYYANGSSNYERGWLTVARDWCGVENGDLGDAFRHTYENDWDFLGCGTPDAYKLEFISRWESDDYELLNVWFHSTNTFHQCDWDNSQPPGDRLTAQELGGLSRGPLLSILWACHGMDLMGEPDYNFSTWYIMGQNNGLAALGATRTTGIPLTEYFIQRLHEQLPRQH